jgi:hypothetical protein
MSIAWGIAYVLFSINAVEFMETPQQKGTATTICLIALIKDWRLKEDDDEIRAE